MQTEEEFRAELAELDRTQAGDVAEEGIRWGIVAAVIAVGVTALWIALRIIDFI